MSNETTTGTPLAATLGERLEEKAHEGDAAAAAPLDAARSARGGGESGVDRAERAVADLRNDRQERPARAGAPRREGRVRAAVRRNPRLAWAVGAGLGAYVFAGMIGRLFRR